jgi:hypothetical protein
MTWSAFYLICFVVGFTLSLLSFLAGAIHIHMPFKWHLPLHAGHHHAGGIHRGAHANAHLPWLNASTGMAFLAWFGGTGYILTQYSHFVALASLAIATIGGLFAGWMVFKFMVKLMRSSNSLLRDEDFRLEGLVGTVSISIREQGIGEVIFLHSGARRSAGARAEDGRPIDKNAEVVIERYENGIAFVKRWDEFTK